MLIGLLKLFETYFIKKKKHLWSIYKLIKEIQNVCHWYFCYLVKCVNVSFVIEVLEVEEHCFMEPQSLLPRSQEHTTESYPNMYSACTFKTPFIHDTF